MTLPAGFIHICAHTHQVQAKIQCLCRPPVEHFLIVQQIGVIVLDNTEGAVVVPPELVRLLQPVVEVFGGEPELQGMVALWGGHRAPHWVKQLSKRGLLASWKQ